MTLFSFILSLIFAFSLNFSTSILAKNSDPIADDKLLLAPSEQNIIRLNEEEMTSLRQAFGNVKYDGGGSDQYIEQIRKLAYKYFPERLIKVLRQQKILKTKRAYIVIEGLPYDEVFFSPSRKKYGPQFKKTSLSENLNVAVGAIIGDPYSYVSLGREIVYNIVPNPATESLLTLELEPHIENAALKHFQNGQYSPVGLILQGVRHQKNGPKTWIAVVKDAIFLMREEDIKELKKPQFLLKVPDHWRKALNFTTPPVPIISDSQDFLNTTAAFYSNMTKPLNEKAQKAFNEFKKAIKQVSIGFDIKPGMLLYIDNDLAMHSRDGFKVKYDSKGGGARWIQRTFIIDDLKRLKDSFKITDRVFDPSQPAKIH